MIGEYLVPYFDTLNWFRASGGPRYVQLYKYMARSIRDQEFSKDTRLPGERKIAEAANVSRVTVRKAIERLVDEGLVVRRQGSGNYVGHAEDTKVIEQSLSSLTSFTEHVKLRGIVSSSVVLNSGLYAPTPAEVITLGLASGDNIARIKRLRSGDGIPMAIESSSLPTDILPNPSDVKTSLYDVLRKNNCAPTRAIQKISAYKLGAIEAKLFKIEEGSALLQIDRTAYLDSGRPIEFTSGIYRSEIYEFVSELRLTGRRE